MTTYDLTTRGGRICFVREQILGLTSQDELAALLGVKRGAVGNWELNKGIKFENLSAIARLSGVPMEWIDSRQGPDPTQRKVIDGEFAEVGRISPPPSAPKHHLIELSRDDFAGFCRRLVSRMIAIGISDIQLAREAGIPAGAVEIFMAAAQEAEVDVPALRPDYIEAIATRLGTNRKWLITGEGDENFCEEPIELQKLTRRLKQAGPEIWHQVMAFLDAVKAQAG
jgi:hypothetical protein